MNHFEVEAALKTATILVDTREQDTPKLQKRIKEMGLPHLREKLAFGDYSIKCQLPSGEEYSLKDTLAIERKMSFSELASCYCTQRERFTREFERAKQADARVYLLVEDASWEKAYSGAYRSKMTPQSFVASVLAWLARYDCKLIFCKQETSGKLIRDILYRELKERLVGLDDGDCNTNQILTDSKAGS